MEQYYEWINFEHIMTYTGKVGYAVLLAGGKSSRMREDKALLSLFDDTLLSHQKRVLSDVASRILVSRSDGMAGHVPDMYKDSGPLAGIHACFHFIASNYSDTLTSDVLILPVDMPLITSEMMEHLVNHGREFGLPCYFRDTNLPIYIPRISKVLDTLDMMLKRDQRIVNTFLDEIGAKSLVCHEPNKIANANTPMQWKILKKSAQAMMAY